MHAMDGTEVRRRRKARGWSQIDLAERAGVSQSMVSRVERGEGADPVTLGVIAQALGTEPSVTAREDKSTTRPSAALAEPGTRDLEAALSQAFDGERHRIGDAAAVLAAFRGSKIPVEGDALLRIAREWLDAAAALRARGEPVTAQAIAWEVSSERAIAKG